MTAERHEVRTVVAAVSIDHARSQRNRWMSRYFAESEAARLAQRAARTVAAELALKRALMALFAQIAPQRSFTERDFVVGRRPNRAPYVQKFPALRRPPKRTLKESLHVSLSHSALHGCGMAVYADPVGCGRRKRKAKP
ncbi:MAG: hypothetical protein GF331_04035 [Chitinivibrionales bacterium]|nr:hypothetical protein [Chitinivibrionales bacterium]